MIFGGLIESIVSVDPFLCPLRVNDVYRASVIIQIYIDVVCCLIKLAPSGSFISK